MKDEVPSDITDAHNKAIDTALKEGKEVGENFNLEKTGIAGTGADKAEFEKGTPPPSFTLLLFKLTLS